MLVITRRDGEKIVVGDPADPIATFTVSSIRGDRVRIMCDAPRELEIHRGEVAAQLAAGVPRTVAVPPSAHHQERGPVGIRQPAPRVAHGQLVGRADGTITTSEVGGAMPTPDRRS